MADEDRKKIFTVEIDRIKIPSNRRPVDESKVRALAESILEIGQQTPITVARISGELVLVAGLHRIEAKKLARQKTIDAVRLSGKTALDRDRWAISENLHRAELSVLERSEHINRWRSFVLKGAQVAHPGGKQPHEKGISRTADELGFSRDDVRRAVTIASISKTIRSEATDSGFSNNQAALLKIAKGANEEQQREILRGLVAGAAQPQPKRAEPNSYPPAPESPEDGLREGGAYCQPTSAETRDAQGQMSCNCPDELDIPPTFIRLSDSERMVADELMRLWSTASPAIRKWFMGKALQDLTQDGDFYGFAGMRP